MRTFPILTAVLSLAVSLVTALPAMTVEVSAKEEYDYYPMACSLYEVDKVVSSGGNAGFEMTACTGDYSEAKRQMYALGDAGVIRSSASYSPSRIIDMSAGVVYTYPQRSGSNTVTIYQYYDLSGSMPAYNKTTAVTWHRELQYLGLYSVPDSDGNAQVLVDAAGFEGYVNLKNVDLIPMAVIENGWGMYLGGNSTYDGEQPFLTYAHQQYYKVEQNGNYVDLVLHYFSGWGNPSNGGKVQEWTSAVGPAADWMKVGDVYYSYDNTTFYTDRTCQNQAGVYYPYYEFVFLRSKTGISESTFNQFLSSVGKDSSSKLWNTGSIWLSAQDKYGVNALEIFAMACLESGYGMSAYAQERNNLFGWNAVDSDPDQASYFSSVEQAINEHMSINLRGYLDINDARYFGSHLGNKGSGFNVKYATDNYWGVKIASIAYAIDKCDNDWNGKLTDFNSVSLGIAKNDAHVDILKSVNGSVLYNTEYGSRYQKNHTLAILAERDGWYEVQSTNVLDTSGNVVTHLSSMGGLDYNFDTMVGWIRKDQVTLINTTPIQITGRTATGDAVQTLDALSWNEDGTLHLEGRSYVPGILTDSENTVTETLTIQSDAFASVSEIPLTVSADSDVLKWSTDVDVSSLAQGTYFFSFARSYSAVSEYSSTYWLPLIQSLPDPHTANGNSYAFSSASLSGTDGLALTVQKVSCGVNASYDEAAGSCVCADGYENYTEGTGCTIKPTEDVSENVMRGVESASLKDQVLTISGMAFLKGMDASDSNQVSLIFRNMETDEETVFDAKMSDLPSPVSLGDSYTYSHVLYEVSADLSGLAAGTYEIQVKVTNGEESGTVPLYCTKDDIDQSENRTDGSIVSFYAEPMYNYRLEVSIGTSGIDKSVISKPIRSASVFGTNSLTIEDGKLSIDAYGLLRGTSITADDHPSYTILIEDENGTVTSYSMNTKACPVDLGKMLQSDYTADEACFDGSIDLASLSEGTYTLYLDLKTDSARDIYELYSLRDMDPVTDTYQGRTYTIAKGKIHDRFELTIAADEGNANG